MPSVFFSPTMGDADLRIALVPERGFADLWMCQVDSPGLAYRDAYWFVTTDRQMATTVVHLCSPGMAQLLVCRVPTRGEAGWRLPEHPCRKRLR